MAEAAEALEFLCWSIWCFPSLLLVYLPSLLFGFIALETLVFFLTFDLFEMFEDRPDLKDIPDVTDLVDLPDFYDVPLFLDLKESTELIGILFVV